MAMIELELVPFKVPTSVAVKGSAKLKQEGFEENRKIHLSELHTKTLEKMCKDFTDSVLGNRIRTTQERG